MRTGLYFGWEGTAGSDAQALLGQVLDQVELDDHLGFDTCLFAESQFEDGRKSISVPELIGALAGTTHGIRLGTANRLIALQHPARIVENYAVLDQLTNGRIVCGIGAGEHESSFAAYGVPFDERCARFEEALDFMRKAWSYDAIAFNGTFTKFPRSAARLAGTFEPEPYTKPYLLPWQRVGKTVNHLAITPRPVQLPYPPIWVDVTDPAMITTAVTHGCAILPPAWMPHGAVVERYQRRSTELAAAGRSLAEIERPLLRDVFVAASREEAIALAADAYQTQYRSHAASGELADASGRRLTADACALEYLLEHHLILGDPDDVFDQLKTLQQNTSINHVICRMAPVGINHLDVLASMRLFAGEVITRLRS